MKSLIVFFSFLALTLIACGLSVFYQKKERLSSFLAVKVFAILSIVALSLVCCNLSYSFDSTSMFVVFGIISLLLSTLISTLPTRNDIFAPFYQILNLIGFISIAVSAFLMLPPSPFAMPAGLLLGIIISLIYCLVKKKFDYKTDLSKFASFSFALAILGQIPMMFLSQINLNFIIFAIAGFFLLIFSIFQTFLKEKEHRVFSILTDVFKYLSLILLAISIYMLIY